MNRILMLGSAQINASFETVAPDWCIGLLCGGTAGASLLGTISQTPISVRSQSLPRFVGKPITIRPVQSFEIAHGPWVLLASLS